MRGFVFLGLDLFLNLHKFVTHRTPTVTIGIVHILGAELILAQVGVLRVERVGVAVGGGGDLESSNLGAWNIAGFINMAPLGSLRGVEVAEGFRTRQSTSNVGSVQLGVACRVVPEGKQSGLAAFDLADFNQLAVLVS